MLGWRHLQRIAQDPRPAMGRGAQPDHMRGMSDQLVVLVMRAVPKGNVDGHALKFRLLVATSYLTASATKLPAPCCSPLPAPRSSLPAPGSRLPAPGSALP